MTSGGPIRTRSERVAALGLLPGRWERARAALMRKDVLGRVGLLLLTAVILGVVIEAWKPPVGYRSGYAPPRDITAREAFSIVNEELTLAARQTAREQVRQVYLHDPQPLVRLKALMRDRVVKLISTESLGETERSVWREFCPPQHDAPRVAREEADRRWQRFRDALTGPEKLDRFDKTLDAVFDPLQETGLLVELDSRKEAQGNRDEILVHRAEQPGPMQIVPVREVLLGDAARVRETLRAKLESQEVAERLFAWLVPRLKKAPTLKLDLAATRRDQQKAVEAVEDVLDHYDAGDAVVRKGQRLDRKAIDRLQVEHAAAMRARPFPQGPARFAAVVMMIFALFLLCGLYMRYRQRRPLDRWSRLVVILVLSVITVALGRWASLGMLGAELVPLMLFGMTVAIAYRRELALLLSGVLALTLVLAIGLGLSELLLLLGVTTAAILNMGSVRARSKLIYVGLFAGAVAFLLEIGMGLIDDQPADWHLLADAGLGGLWALGAGFLMTGLLPFVERAFGVLTDLSLLELGDVTHPLLQEMIRRAPSTYNHSVTVGTISEAAADAIEARGLLCRVGAYFHDVGKMLKPGYYIENQGAAASRHESLVPTMSSLVIVAHIKDGADLARQYHLPQPIIDLIEQHHGTTRVGFFYERASEQKQADPNGGEVDETAFRYPGPKPQTKEAAVLMLADSVESASRTLVDPTPARIENLIREITERRLGGGQFDESGLTLRELRTIAQSMVKSLISIYHGRIKYPDQRTA